MLISLEGKRKIVARGEYLAETKSGKAVRVDGAEYYVRDGRRGAREGASNVRIARRAWETEITKLRLSNSLSPKTNATTTRMDFQGGAKPAGARRRRCEEAEEDEVAATERYRARVGRRTGTRGTRRRSWRCFEVLSFRRRVLSARAGAC